MRTTCLFLLTCLATTLAGQTQPVPLGARVNPEFTAPATVISKFSGRHPNIHPAWRASGENFAASFSETGGAVKYTEIYDRNGRLLSYTREMPVSEQPKSVRQYVSSVFDTEPARVWNLSDSSGTSTLFVTGGNDTIWFKAPGQNSTASALNSEDSGLLNDLAALVILDVTSAQLTLVNSGDTAMTTAARSRIGQAEKFNAALGHLATSRNLKLPSELNGKHQDEYLRLSKLQGSAYDKAYSKLIISTDKRVQKQLRTLARHGSDAALRSWAQSMKELTEANIRNRRRLCNSTATPNN